MQWWVISHFHHKHILYHLQAACKSYSSYMLWWNLQMKNCIVLFQNLVLLLPLGVHHLNETEHSLIWAVFLLIYLGLGLLTHGHLLLLSLPNLNHPCLSCCQSSWHAWVCSVFPFCCVFCLHLHSTVASVMLDNPTKWFISFLVRKMWTLLFKFV